MNMPNINLDQAQITVENSVDELQSLSRRAKWAYMGLLGLAYDEAKSRWTQGKQMLNRAENRGEALDEQAMAEAQKMYEQAGTRINTLQNRVRRNTNEMEEQISDDMEARIETVLNRLNIPSREQIMRLNNKIDALSRKIEEMGVLENNVATEPMPRYEQMTAKEVVSRLDALSIEELTAVKQYEMAHENRVTVLREVDSRLQAMPVARYDDMSVQEVEPLLNTLSDNELEYLAKYEAAHENRVTMLRAIDAELKSRPQA
jgi:poly(hydroxyalkanoate) granule-associated protein